MSAALNLDQRPKSAEELAQYLHGVGLFADIKADPNAMSALAQIMSEQRYAAGHNILIEGAEGGEMFILVSGQAAVWKRTPGGDEYKVAILPGDKHIAFGESGLVEGEQRSATIRCETECVCLVLKRTDFEKFSLGNPPWALGIYRRIATNVMARLRKTNNDMLLLYNALVAEIRGH